MQRLAAVDGTVDSARRAGFVLSSLAGAIAQHPLAFGHLLGAAEFEAHGAVSVAIAGRPGTRDFTRLAHTVAARYVPSLVLAGGDAGSPALLEGKKEGPAGSLAFVCRGFTCDAPTAEPSELASQLALAARLPR
jgi:hypothetical protein